MAGYGQKLVQLWNDWQLTAAVLLSLSLHLLLLSTGGLRRRSRPSWWNKKYYWVLYIGSSWIAPLALGILSRASKGNADADIQAFWAAFLLFHLGGVDDFTALSLEDNKLWDRPALKLTIHAVTTGYVLSRYFVDPSFRRFIVPFVAISCAGAVKCVEQIFALNRATMKKLIESVLGNPDAGPDYDDFMDRVDGILRSGVLPSFTISSENVDQPNAGPSTSTTSNADVPVTVEAGHKQLLTPKQATKIIKSAHFLFEKFKVLFADGIFSFKDRQDGQAMFSDSDAHRAFKVIEVELSFVYDRLYTKASVSPTKVGLPIRVASLLLTLAGSLYASFAIWRSSQYKPRHRCVTYTLLAEAVLTDVVALVARLFSVWSLLHSDWLMKRCCVRSANRRRWSGWMAQSNLITICIQKLPTESEFEALLSQLLPTTRTILLDSLGGSLTAVGMPRAAHLGRLTAEELELSDGFQKYFGRPSVMDQIRSGSFWKYYKKTRHVPVSDQLKDFIFKEIKDSCLMKNAERDRIKQEIKDREKTSQERNGGEPFPDYRYSGKIALGDKEDNLKWSIPDQKEFDESLLIWHIATDLRFREEGAHPDPETRKFMDIGSELSKYLLYIMVVHPLMLSSSTTLATKRCKDTIAEARRHFLKKHAVMTWTSAKKNEDATSSNAADGGDKAVTEKNAHKSLLKVVEDTPLHASVVKGDKSKSVLWDGCFLAEELKRIMPNPKTRWEVISKVWVEMLCYAAVHCGGYQHAERLKEGGELITFVCLLMTHLGMGKHYRTEVGDAYPYLSRYSAANK